MAQFRNIFVGHSLYYKFIPTVQEIRLGILKQQGRREETPKGALTNRSMKHGQFVCQRHGNFKLRSSRSSIDISDDAKFGQCPKLGAGDCP